MRFRLTLWLVLSTAGVVLLGLPDHGVPLVAFSGAHGLTLLDAMAVGLLVAGWLPIAVLVWQRRADATSGVSEPARRAAVFLAGLASGLLVASIFGDFGGWWVVGTAILVALQVAGFLLIARS
ncbi:hypothetical protein [Gaiella sp.]|uniref:hypothetical protein n=1 Tax=Gaiella sp. TaxID=2663207 RepID=UPI0039832D06